MKIYTDNDGRLVIDGEGKEELKSLDLTNMTKDTLIIKNFTFVKDPVETMFPSEHTITDCNFKNTGINYYSK